MKKVGLVLFVTLILFVACGERYEESRGPVFDGTWAVSGKASFLHVRKHGDKDFLLFYSGGTYDSSFFYRLADSVVWVHRIKDSVDVKRNYVKTDSAGNVVKDSIGNPIIITETIRGPQKPLDPKSEADDQENYYGTISFDSSGAQLTMTIRRHRIEAGQPLLNEAPLFETVYIRPKEE